MALADVLPSSAGGALNRAAGSQYNPVNMGKNARGYLDAKVNQWLVKPVTAEGIAGFVFDYEGETVLTAETDITDHYTEQNTFFQDHAALRPLEVTLHGFVSELVQKAPQGILGLLAGMQSKLTTLDAILGHYTPAATRKVQKALTKASNSVNRLDNVINRTQNFISLFASGNPAPTAVEKAFADLMALRDERRYFTLVSPWGFLGSKDINSGVVWPRYFVIKRLSFTAEEATKSWVDISVSLKEVRFADVQGSGLGLSSSAAIANNNGRSAYQRQGPVNKGSTSGQTAPFSDLSDKFKGPLDL